MRIYSQEGPFKPQPWLPETEYNAVLLRMVKYCHDVIFVNSLGHFVLPTRAAGKSAPWVWFVGGQVSPFIPLEESLQKTIKRETGLNLSQNRYVHVEQIRCWFNDREGSSMHDAVSDVFVVQLATEEINAVSLDRSEYRSGSLRSYTLTDLQQIPDEIPRRIFTDLWDKVQSVI